VVKLDEHRNWTFIWAEMAFLSRWYRDANDEQKAKLKRRVV
jgi:hypothetical protein